MQNRVYFEYLDALRFLAYCAVFITHTGVLFPVASDWYYSLYRNVISHGGYGVNFFFILSGFLITYLLLREKKKTGTVDIGFFYMKRVLRIWPLYFLVFLGSLFILPIWIKILGVEYIPGLGTTFTHLRPALDQGVPFWFALFLGNFFMAYDLGRVPFAISVLWSVCVEEQFYLIWPWFVKWFKSKGLLIISMLLFAISFIYKMIHLNDANLAYYSTLSVSMDLATGCAFGIVFFRYQREILAAWHAYRQNGFWKSLRIQYARSTDYMRQVKSRVKASHIIFLLAIIASIAFAMAAITIRSEHIQAGHIFRWFYDFARLMKRPVLDMAFLALLAFFVIRSSLLSSDPESSEAGKSLAEVAAESHAKRRTFGSKLYAWITYGGKISYGLYGYHAMVLLAVLAIFSRFGIGPNGVTVYLYMAISIISFALTFVLAHYSYILIEHKFLKLRSKLKKQS